MIQIQPMPVPPLCPDAIAGIGARLRRTYADSAFAGLPRRHVELILQLRAQERAQERERARERARR
ncbi:hypothetical protein [Methylobacterium planeticum]|uniref:Uncharacterized protein n=1 Tax=Methylobacterium planeticum TaxID=2615211 RepID=A0A6N6MRZ4_9HYPH|nr:hypothetical protein [Methylobacterium planeticum]KAB1074317.1 hypothetical protein F6X51_08035 [Methylobacterium planeticum]